MRDLTHNYKGLKVLVTGSTGFKGCWLSFWLNKMGARVIGVALKPEKNSILFKELKLEKKIKQYITNIQNFEKINQIVKREKPDIIFHLAAQSIVSLSYKKPLETFKTNAIGSANILESFRLNKIPNIVYITSDKCYLNLDTKKSYTEKDRLGGFDNYSSSKASAELIFNSYFKSYFNINKRFLNVASARAGNVIGGGDMKENRLIPDTIKSINKGTNLKIRSPNSTRPWQHVLEPISGYLILGQKLMNKKLKSSIDPSWNFGPEKKNCKTVINVTKNILKEWGSKKKISLNKSKMYESKFLSLNINKAKKELKWKPKLNFNETIRFTVDWYKNFLINKKNIVSLTSSQIDYYINKK